MFNKVTLTALTLGSAVALSAPAFAETPVPLMDKDIRVLRVDAGLCDSSKEDMASWAAGIDGYGAYAVPVYPASVTIDCAEPAAVLPVGQSWGFADQKAADIAAMQQCEANLPDGFDSCALVGQSFSK
ncbi:hypothetical protein [Arenibacterium sp. LLYu02]|uniref:hypothetical protein n=1 Tax=Arenibacterium sp. LLYu02 TaxID=3404132 RepID=UPI003B21D82E